MKISVFYILLFEFKTTITETKEELLSILLLHLVFFFSNNLIPTFFKCSFLRSDNVVMHGPLGPPTAEIA